MQPRPVVRDAGRRSRPAASPDQPERLTELHAGASAEATPPWPAPRLERLAALDGLRAVAVAWVAAYHYLYFWTPAGPGGALAAYGDAYAGWPLVSVGFLGVHLFFMVSGFVILMTLENTASLGKFLLNRVIRLWPPLLLLGSATFLVGRLFGPPELQASWAEYLLSLVVVPPQYIGRILGEPGWGWLDGAYWSLLVEAKFYLLMGIAFYLGRGRAIRLWMLYELAAMAVGAAAHLLDSGTLTLASGFLFQRYLPYFSFGIAGYLAFTGRLDRDGRRLLLLALVHVSVVTLADAAGPLGANAWRLAEYVAGQVALFALFAAFAWRRSRLRLFAHPLLAAPGRASYGIYLLHQNVGLAALSAGWAAAGGLLAPLAVFAAVTAVAMLSYRHVELPLQAALKRIAFRRAAGPATAAALLAELPLAAEPADPATAAPRR